LKSFDYLLYKFFFKKKNLWFISATLDEYLIDKFTQVLGSKPVHKSSYFEVSANAKNSPHNDYTKVFMYVNAGYVSLERVMLPWDNLIEVDWTILDR